MSLCPVCNIHMDRICYECGAFYDEPEYQIFDIFNYTRKQPNGYQTIVHFKEVLNNFQAREMKHIPPTVFDIVKKEIKNNTQYLNGYVLRGILKKHKLSKYVENVNSILFTLTGLQPPYIPKLIELKLIKYFKQVSRVYGLCKSQNRTNFLNYYYVLYKLLELLNYDDLLGRIPRIKSKHRILEHDRTWKLICDKLNWQFIKTKLVSNNMISTTK